MQIVKPLLLMLGLASPTYVTAQSDTSWAGVHVNLTFGVTKNGEAAAILSSPTEGTTPVGLQLGYNVQRDGIVMGGDIAYYELDDDVISVPSSFMGPITEARLRVGYAQGYALFYGALGYAMGNFDDTIRNFDMDGVTYGIGVDYMIADGWSLGAELMQRQLTGTDSGVELTYEHTAMQLRLGFQF